MGARVEYMTKNKGLQSVLIIHGSYVYKVLEKTDLGNAEPLLLGET